MIHCTPVEESERSCCSWGTAIATIVWSMKVIETAKIIAARISFWLAPPVDSMPVAFAAAPPIPSADGPKTGSSATEIGPSAGWFDRVARLMPDIFWLGLGIALFCVFVGFVAGVKSRTTSTGTAVAIAAFLGVMAAFPLLAIGLANSESPRATV